MVAFDFDGRKDRKEEVRTVEFVLREQDDLYDVRTEDAQYTFRPERLRLVWKRHNDGPWTRQTSSYSASGSKFYGPRVVRNGTSDKYTGYHAVFRGSAIGDPLTRYAQLFPGLPELIEAEEAKLPA